MAQPPQAIFSPFVNTHTQAWGKKAFGSISALSFRLVYIFIGLVEGIHGNSGYEGEGGVADSIMEDDRNLVNYSLIIQGR